VVNAPIEKVWVLLAEPSNYASWWDAETRSIVPAGRAAPGQTTHAKSGGLNIYVVVNRIDETQHQLQLTTKFPFGITVHNHLSCKPLDRGVCQVSFG